MASSGRGQDRHPAADVVLSAVHPRRSPCGLIRRCMPPRSPGFAARSWPDRATGIAASGLAASEPMVTASQPSAPTSPRVGGSMLTISKLKPSSTNYYIDTAQAAEHAARDLARASGEPDEY
jgi:hypothetical protein